MFGIALGYEDLNDHDDLRHDPLMSVLAGKLKAWRADCAPVAGKSTLNRLELSRATPTKYRKIAHDPATIEGLFVDLFIEAHAKAPRQITLDLDATDDPVHGDQEGRFFNGYYDGYCYLPLYVFCGRHLLAAKLRPSNVDGAAGATQEIARIVAQIRARWPRVRILFRGDSGFCREDLMVWCEVNQLRLWFSSFAYVLVCAVRRIGLRHTQFAEATAGTIRLKLFKIGALVKVSARRIKFALPTACPYANEWRLAACYLARAAPV